MNLINRRFNGIRPALSRLFAIAALAAAPSVAIAGPLTPDDYRLVSSARKFDDTSQLALAYRLAAPARLRAHHLELAVGTVFADADNRPFVSLGPVWRFPVVGPAAFIDVGFSPTVLSGSKFNGRELGGNFHFTSRLAIGTRLGRYRHYSLALQAQHTSNGGINGTNPGLDMVGVTFAIEFRD